MQRIVVGLGLSVAGISFALGFGGASYWLQHPHLNDNVLHANQRGIAQKTLAFVSSQSDEPLSRPLLGDNADFKGLSFQQAIALIQLNFQDRLSASDTAQNQQSASSFLK